MRYSASIFNQYTLTKDPTRLPNDTTNVGLHPSNRFDFQLGLGYEKQFMNKKFVHYYGVELNWNYFNEDDDYYNAVLSRVYNNFTNTTDRLVRVFRVGPIPFVGAKYYIRDYLSIGVETGFSIYYFNQKITEVSKKLELVNGEYQYVFVKDKPIISHGLQTFFNNLRFVTIGYAF